MPIYEYKGYDTGGGTKTGIIDADAPREARARLRDQGVMVTDLTVSEVSSHTDAEEAKGPRKSWWKRTFRFERSVKGAWAARLIFGDDFCGKSLALRAVEH